MITIFTNPRPFVGQFDIIQRNAIRSWMELKPECEIILFEDEEQTTSKVAKELGIKCVSDIERNEFGTPLFNSIFNKIQNIAENKVVAQVNADVILFSDFIKAVKLVRESMGDKPFFITGRRVNLEIREPIQFKDKDWESKLISCAKKEGKLHGLSGMDYWVFLRDFNLDVPPFVVGRPGIDSWLIYKTRSLKMSVIDATKMVKIIHQNHNYPKKKTPFFEREKERNIKLAGGFSCVCTLRDVNLILTENGLKGPEFPRNIFAQLTLFYPWRLFLALKRKIYRQMEKI